MYVSMKEILMRAKEGGYGVAAPNVQNEDTVRACIDAAEKTRSPIIIGPGYSSHKDLPFLARMVRELAERTSVPVALNLDHGAKIEHCFDAIRFGFNGVMIDASTKPFSENCEIVRQVTTVAHALGVGVEAELGHVGQGLQYDIDKDAALTNPREAEDFVQKTEVDALAIAIGSAHGAYKGTPRLDFDRLYAIRKAVSVPLVLHGGSGTGDENLAKACQNGICKVNLATDLYAAAGQSALAWLQDGGHGFRAYNALSEGYRSMLMHYMEVIGSSNQA